MAIVMNQKIDIYMANPNYFLTDLQRQKSEWIVKVVHPLGSHYEASKQQIDMIKQIAQNERTAQEQRLARIALINQIIIGVLFMGIDICAAGALRGVSPLTKRFSSQQNFEAFRTSGGSFEDAWRAFASQSPTMVDAIIADIDGKLRGVVSTGAATSVISTISSLTSDITAALPTVDAAQFAGPLAFQNSVEATYTTTCNSIYDTFVALVRDSNGPPAGKRQVASLLAHTPFCKPPDLSLGGFSSFFSNFFELSYWCQLISGTANTAQHFGLVDNYLADTINKRILFLTGCYLTHRGGERAPPNSIRVVQRDPIGLADLVGGDIRMAWDGYCGVGHSSFCKEILAEGSKRLTEPLFIALGESARLTHG